MVSLFISQNESALLEIGNHVATGDFAPVKTILHKMKPSVMVMGVGAATEIIRQIEQMDFAALDEALFISLLKKLEKTLKIVNSQLRVI